MDKLPKGWRILPFEKVVLNLDSKRIPLKSGDRDIQKGDIPYYGASGIIDYIDKFIFDGEHLLISEDGANLLARTYPIAFIANGRFWVNNHAHIVIAKSDITTNRYLELYFSSINISEYVTGSAQPKLNQSKLNSIPIPLPPLPEQTRIVNKLDSLFERIDKSIALLEENIKHTEALMASVLEEVLTSSKDSIEISKLVVKTENINPQNNPETIYTYIDISSVNNKTHIIENPSELQGKDAPSRARKSVIKGDFFFATTRPNLRNIAVIDSDYLNPIASTGFCVLRANSGASKDFLFLCLLSNNIQEQIKPFIRGAQYPAISDKDLLQCKIPKLNIEKQIKVSEKVMRIREKLALLSSEQQSKLSYLKALKASLLDKAFKGEL